MVLNIETLDYGLDKEQTAFLEAVGIEIYSKYGYDRYDYTKNGRPVNIPLIKRDFEEADEKGFICGVTVKAVAFGIVSMYESE